MLDVSKFIKADKVENMHTIHELENGQFNLQSIDSIIDEQLEQEPDFDNELEI